MSVDLKIMTDDELLKTYELHRILSNVLDSKFRNNSEKIKKQLIIEIERRKKMKEKNNGT